MHHLHIIITTFFLTPNAIISNSSVLLLLLLILLLLVLLHGHLSLNLLLVYLSSLLFSSLPPSPFSLLLVLPQSPFELHSPSNIKTRAYLTLLLTYPCVYRYNER